MGRLRTGGNKRANRAALESTEIPQEEMKQRALIRISELRQDVAQFPMLNDEKHLQELDEAESLIHSGRPVTWGDLTSLSIIMWGRKWLRRANELYPERPGKERHAAD